MPIEIKVGRNTYKYLPGETIVFNGAVYMYFVNDLEKIKRSRKDKMSRFSRISYVTLPKKEVKRLQKEYDWESDTETKVTPNDNCITFFLKEKL